MSQHPEAAARFIADNERMAWHDRSIWNARKKRDAASHSIEEWEQLRSWASDIKDRSGELHLINIYGVMEPLQRTLVDYPRVTTQ